MIISWIFNQENNENYMAASFGAILAEMIVFLLNIQITKYEITTLAEQGEACAIITSKAYLERLQDTASIGRSIIFIEDIYMPAACAPLVKPMISNNAPTVLLRGFNVQPKEVEECIMESMLTKDCRVYEKK